MPVTDVGDDRLPGLMPILTQDASAPEMASQQTEQADSGNRGQHPQKPATEAPTTRANTIVKAESLTPGLLDKRGDEMVIELLDGGEQKDGHQASERFSH